MDIGSVMGRGLATSRGMSRQSLWISLLLLLMPLCAAAETHATAAQLDWLSVAWSTMIILITAFALFMFGILLIYCMDLVTEVLVFRTGLYDLLYGLLCERFSFHESAVRHPMYAAIALCLKYIGLAFEHMICYLLGSQLGVFWNYLWQFEYVIYVALCTRTISPEHDTLLLTLIKTLEILMGSLCGRRFGLHWLWLPHLGSLLIGVFRWWFRLGLYRY